MDIINLELFASEEADEVEENDIESTEEYDFEGVYYIRNAKNGERYIQGGYKLGHVRVSEKNDCDLQKWIIKKHESFGYTIENVQTQKCLSVDLPVWGIIPVLERPWKKSTGQLWNIIQNSDDTVCLRTRLNTSKKTGSAISVVDKLDGVTLGTDHLFGGDVFLGARWLLEKCN